MNWITGLQDSLDYIESHLEDDISIHTLCQFTQQSTSYYQRMFHMTTGFSLAAYIRNRRMSRAGELLRGEGISVLEAALRFQYDTAESFTKAFKRFHGITPSQAKHTSLPLHSFTPLHLQFHCRGASSLSYRMLEAEAFQVEAYARSFSTEETSIHQEIPLFWQSFFQAPVYAAYLAGRSSDTITGGGILGVDTMAFDQQEDSFFYYAGIEVKNACRIEDSILLTIPAHTWLIFSCHGSMPDAIQTLWKQIYGDFFPHNNFEPCLDYHFELYFPERMEEAEIWVPIQQKGQTT